jgi:hypothetical protein
MGDSNGASHYGGTRGFFSGGADPQHLAGFRFLPMAPRFSTLRI